MCFFYAITRETKLISGNLKRASSRVLAQFNAGIPIGACDKKMEFEKENCS